MTIIVNHDYLLKLAKKDLTDEEILKGYFEYYFCQDRQLSDVKNDYFNACSSANKNADIYMFQTLTSDDIKNAVEKLEEVLNEFLRTHFDIVIKNTVVRW